MRRFLRRVPDGGGILPAINPAGLPFLEIYLSGQVGITPNTQNASLTNWADQSGNARDFNSQPAGTIAPLVKTVGEGLNANISNILTTVAATPRVVRNPLLPVFTQARGSTQYIFARFTNTSNEGIRVNFWPNGNPKNGPSLIYQGSAFSFFGGVPNGKTAIQIGSTGFDTTQTPTDNTWYLWTLVSDTASGQKVYLNGALLTDLGTVLYTLQDEMQLGGPGITPTMQTEQTAYLLYTDTHSAATIKGVHAWFRGVYGGIA
jgi:hypothetical protein